MSKKRKRPINVLSLLLTITLFNPCRSINLTEYFLVSPKIISEDTDDLALFSCVHSLGLKSDAVDPATGLLTDKYVTKKVSLINSSAITNRQCENQVSNSSYSFMSDPMIEFKRIQLTTEKESVLRMHDVFVPSPVRCYGKTYVYTFFHEISTSLIAFNPGSSPLPVQFIADKKLDWDVILPNAESKEVKETNVISQKLNPGEWCEVAPLSRSKGIKVTADKPFGALIGIGFRTNNPTLEHLPPRSFFGKEYIIADATAASGNLVTITLIPVSSAMKTTIQIIPLREGSKAISVSTSTYHEITDVSGSQRITADYPIKVVRISSASSSSPSFSMTTIPPTNKWQWAAVVYPIVATKKDNEINNHIITVALKTSHINGFQVVDLATGKEVTNRVEFKPLPKSDFSSADVSLSLNDEWYIQHLDSKLFQVMQYGQYSDGRGYAFSVTSDLCGRFKSNDSERQGVKATGGTSKPCVDLANAFLGMAALFLAMITTL